jgi:hypothetical protein
MKSAIVTRLPQRCGRSPSHESKASPRVRTALSGCAHPSPGCKRPGRRLARRFLHIVAAPEPSFDVFTQPRPTADLAALRKGDVPRRPRSRRAFELIGPQRRHAVAALPQNHPHVSLHDARASRTERAVARCNERSMRSCRSSHRLAGTLSLAISSRGGAPWRHECRRALQTGRAPETLPNLTR